MQYGERIRSRRSALGMNQAELAAKIGVSRNTVAGWETDHSRPDLNTLPALCSALGITINAFFGTERKRTAEESRVLDVFFSLEAGDRESLLWQMEAVRDRRAMQREKEAYASAGRTVISRIDPAQPRRSGEEPVPLPQARSRVPQPKAVIPLPESVTLFRNELGTAAGFGAALGEAQGEKITLLADPETRQADEVIVVCGNSMEPSFYDGELVLVQHTKELREGEIGIFLVDNEGYIKEYRKDGLHSHNPAYRTMTFHEEQTVRCVGRVIGKVKDSQIPTREQLNRIEEAGKAGKEST